MFCIFAFLSAAATVFLSSYISPLLSYYTGHNAAAVNKLMSLREFMLTDFSLISSALMPLYWMFLMAVYFTLGNEGGVIKELEAAPSGSGFRKEYRSEYYTGPELETGQEELPAQENVEDFTDDFSLSNAFYFSWGIYKKLFLKLTSAMIAVNALFVFICAAALFALVRFSAIPDIFAGKLPPVVNMFVILGCAFLVYYILMFFYVSFVRGFFRGKGVVLGNFFPPFKVTARFFGFVAFIAAFILSVPFIVEKADMILQLAVKSFSFPFASLVAALSLIFAVIIVYALVSLFYVPFFILDGHKFADSLTTCTQMMKGQRMAFFCVLFLLALINMAGHLTVIGFLFTVPFSVLVVMQIYITISSDYSKYKEDIVAYE
jgi:hypothetical protein